MKKSIALILSAVTALSIPFCAAASETETEAKIAAEENLESMAETLQAFDEAHPDYRDLWQEMMESMQTIKTSAISEAFQNIQERVGTLMEEAPEDGSDMPDEETIEEIQGLMEQMVELINARVMTEAAASFGIFDELAEDGEYSLDEDNSLKEADAFSDEKLQAVLDDYSAFLEEHPEFAAHESDFFGKVNDIIEEEFAKANTREENLAALEELFDKYNVPEEDREEILKIHKSMVHQINDNFVAAFMADPLTEDIHLVPEE